MASVNLSFTSLLANKECVKPKSAQARINKDILLSIAMIEFILIDIKLFSGIKSKYVQNFYKIKQ